MKGKKSSKFGAFITPAEVALVCLKFNFHKILFTGYSVMANLIKSRALLILDERWRVMTIQNC